VAIETELKLSLSPRTAAPLPQHPLLQGAAPTRKHIRNTDYGTADLSLKQAHIAVHHRHIGRQRLFPIKSAEPAAGGLAQRSEWGTACLAGQFLFSYLVLAGTKGNPVRRWLLTRRELLLPILDQSLAAFFERKLPWEHS
jgi:hypothetical protein